MIVRDMSLGYRVLRRHSGLLYSLVLVYRFLGMSGHILRLLVSWVLSVGEKIRRTRLHVREGVHTFVSRTSGHWA